MKKFGSFLIYTFVLVLAGLFNWISIDEAIDAAKVIQTRNTYVEIQATISSYDERTEIDEGYESVYYDIYVSYEHNGKEYSGVRYDSSYSEPELGKVVTVRIDPENPGVLLADKTEFGLIILIIPIFLAIITGVVYFFSRSVAEFLLKKFGVINESIPRIFALIFVGCKVIAESLIFYVKYSSIIFAVFSLIAVALNLKIFMRKTIKIKPKESEPRSETT